MQYLKKKRQLARVNILLIGFFLLVSTVHAQEHVTDLMPFNTVVFLSSSSQALSSSQLESQSGAISLGPQPSKKALAYLGSKYGLPLNTSNIRMILADLRSIYAEDSNAPVQLSVLKPFTNSTALQIVIDERDRTGVIEFAKRKLQPPNLLTADQIAGLATKSARERKTINPDDMPNIDDDFLAKNIRAIVLVSDPSFFDINSSYPHEGVLDFGSRPPPNLLDELKEFIGGSGNASIPRIKKIATDAYLADNRREVQIWIEPRMPSTGIVKILISPKQADMARFIPKEKSENSLVNSKADRVKSINQHQEALPSGEAPEEEAVTATNWVLGKIGITGVFGSDSAQIAENLNIKPGEIIDPEILATAFKNLNSRSDKIFEFRYEQVSAFPPTLDIIVAVQNPIISQNSQRRLNVSASTNTTSQVQAEIEPVYRLGQYRVTGAKRTGVSNIIARMTPAPGDIIDRDILRRDLAQLNRSLFRTVTMAFEQVRGKPYILDIALTVNEAKETRIFSSINNGGVSRNVKYLIDGGFQFNSLGLWDQSFLYKYNGEPNFTALHGHTFQYSAILPSGHQFDAVAQYNRSQSSVITSVGGAFNQVQQSTAFNVKYTLPLFLTEGGLSMETYIGLTAKDRQFQTELNNVPQASLHTRIYQITPGLKVSKADENFSYSIDGKLTVSPGQIDNLNTNSSFQIERSGTSADYIYANISGNFTYDISTGWYLKGKVNTQISNDRLLSSEKLGAGGNSSVRGFDSGVATGDFGAVGSLELYLPGIEHALSNGKKSVIQPFLFVDGAILGNVNALADEDEASLLSVGAGFEYTLGNHFSFAGNAGWQLVDRNTTDQNSARVYFRASVNF